MSLDGGPKAMLFGVQLTLLAVLLDFWIPDAGQVAFGAVGTLLVVAGYRFD